MLIRCPKCRTTYKVADEVLKGAAPAFRCSRCKHTFDLELGETAESPNSPTNAAASAAVASSVDQELTLPFSPRTQYERAEGNEQKSSDSPATEENTDDRRVDRSEQWSMSDHERRDEHPFTMAEISHPVESEKVMDAPKDFSLSERVFPSIDVNEESGNARNILPIATYLEQRASIFPFITLFGLLVIGFSLIALISHAHPKTSEDIVKKIPLIGASVLQNNHLKEGILIQSLRASYQTIQGNREVFLISGVALNQNPVVIREIQLSGKTFNEEGKELEHQAIWAGNTMSQKILRGMTTEDIPHLQNLKPLKSFEVPPGDSVPFTIVFLKSTKYAKDFSCEVIAAQGEV